VRTPRLVGLSNGPETITLVRHGESVGNLADLEAHRRGADRLDLDVRDADVELSDRGRQQADALHDWFQGADVERPDLVISSPYRRAAETARIATDGLGLEVLLDERLRERSLGALDGLTGQGIRSEYPEEAERRSKLGKFYYQPPGGESWADVVLRIRSLLADLRHGYDGVRVLLFSHEAVIKSFRYVLDGLDEHELMEMDHDTRLPNASLSTWRRSGSELQLEEFGDTAAVDRADTDVTAEQGASLDG
jgi:broad specificity phosphatase PhoE